VTRTFSSPDFTRFPVRLTNSISGARDNRSARENLRCDVDCALEFERGSNLSSTFYTGARQWAAVRVTVCETLTSWPLSYAPAYFDGNCTVNCLRPFFRRRANTSRPQRVDIRSRNPCVLIRRLLRGR
jgi:hypothetical protein